jgi:hypothetical protein
MLAFLPACCYAEKDVSENFLWIFVLHLAVRYE